MEPVNAHWPRPRRDPSSAARPRSITVMPATLRETSPAKPGLRRPLHPFSPTPYPELVGGQARRSAAVWRPVPVASPRPSAVSARRSGPSPVFIQDAAAPSPVGANVPPVAPDAQVCDRSPGTLVTLEWGAWTGVWSASSGQQGGLDDAVGHDVAAVEEPDGKDGEDGADGTEQQVMPDGKPVLIGTVPLAWYSGDSARSGLMASTSPLSAWMR